MAASLHKARRPRLRVAAVLHVALVGGLVEAAAAVLALDEAVVDGLYDKF